jgi:phospholipid/cholesterol/gamma-HCH transport system substrate-binding protein
MAVIPTVAQVDWTATFKRASDALDSMVNFAEDASLAMRRLNTGDGALSALLNDPETAAELRDLAHNLAALSRELRSGDGTAARLLSQPETYDQISSVLARLERITASADSGSGTIARLLSDPDLGARIDSLVAGSDDLVSSVQSGGTTGRLIHDERLYQDLTTAIAELRALVTDMRENPRKYFKVSVF